jgi:hypothetical protein
LIINLLDSIAGPRHRHCSRCGGRRHRHPTPAPPHPPPASATLNPRVLEQDPSPGRPAYQLMEPSDPMPLHEVIEATHVPSMVGAHALTRLKRWSGLHHGAMRGGGGRRRRTTVNHGRLRPSSWATDPPDGEEDRRPMRPTPRTYRAKDHHAARLADTLPHRTTTQLSWPIRIWYATRS